MDTSVTRDFDTELSSPEREDLRRALSVLAAGGIILYPTDTVWGIGCDATNESAVQRIFRLKQRSDSKSMLVLVGSQLQLADIVGNIDNEHKRLITDTSRPTTIIYPKATGLSRVLYAEDGSVGIRITAEEFSNRLCQEFGRPIVSTSANISGETTPSTFIEIADEIKRQVDYICTSGRDNPPSSSSSILKIMPNGSIVTLR
ncbi:MAG: L-threonylcarbamoyladenylate synthase [Prevotella sp.]|nr:L-threonylcarbamoyladenylate synthase [Prevotella sp.]